MPIGPGAAFLGHKYMRVNLNPPGKKKGKGEPGMLDRLLKGKPKETPQQARMRREVFQRERIARMARLGRGPIPAARVIPAERRPLLTREGRPLNRRLQPGDMIYDPVRRTYVDPFAGRPMPVRPMPRARTISPAQVRYSEPRTPKLTWKQKVKKTINKEGKMWFGAKWESNVKL